MAARIVIVVALAGAGFLVARALAPDEARVVTTTIAGPTKTVVSRPSINSPAAAAKLPALILAGRVSVPAGATATQTSATNAGPSTTSRPVTTTKRATTTDTTTQKKSTGQLQPPPFQPHDGTTGTSTP